jgi:hypothetical protein
MKQNFTRIGVLALLFVGMFAASAKPAQSQTKPADGIQVLFIGNSLTYVNDLPKMVTELAKAGGQRPLLTERETPGGCTLEKHWKDGKALAKIQARKWDYVVLQEYSTGPLLKRDSMFDYGKKFDAEIKKQGARTLLYMTWAYQDKPEDQPAISKAYLDLAADLKADVAPVGKAWEAAILSDKKPVLHQKDKKHPTATGTYLAACVFYATIYGKSPEGLPGSIGNLTDEEAHSLQVIAWETVKKADK